jgi:hypothetical protein
MSDEPKYEIKLKFAGISQTTSTSGRQIKLTLSTVIREDALDLWNAALRSIRERGITVVDFRTDIVEALHDEVKRLGDELEALQGENNRLRFGLDPKK